MPYVKFIRNLTYVFDSEDHPGRFVKVNSA